MFTNKNAIFRYILLNFIVGIAIGSLIPVDFFLIYLIILFSVIFYILFRQNHYYLWLFLALISLALGIWRYQVSLPKIDETKISYYNNQRLSFEGMIIEAPDVRINHTKLTVLASQMANKKIFGKVLLNVALYPEYYYGDKILINCRLSSPEPFNDFAYDRYLAREGIYSVCDFSKIQLISRNQGNFLLLRIFNFKAKLQSIINTNLPEPSASLFSAIILGAKRSVPQEIQTQFSLVGASHLLAISGLHITLIMAILMEVAMVLFIPRKKSFWLITVVLAVYVVMIGFPPSAVRAFIMGWLVMFAMYCGRLNKSINALIFAAALMLLINPKILRDDIGFQLSFSAVLGLIYFSPLFEKWLKFFPATLGLRQILQMTFSAQVATLPLIVYNFGQISIVGPIANLLILPVLPYLMALGFLALFLSLILDVLAINFAIGFITLSQVLFWPVWLVIVYILKIVAFFSDLPFAAITI